MLRKPKTLKSGSRVAAICLSSGIASVYPEVFDWGRQQIQNELGLEVVPMKNTLRSPEELYKDPALRVADFYEAWERPDIDGVISVIGGDDSIRLLKLLDPARVRRHSKVFLGCSDTTVSHLFLHQCGIASFYGPAVIYGFAEFGGLNPYTVDSFRKAAMSGEVIGEISPFVGDSVAGYSSWKDPELTIPSASRPNPPWKWLSGSGVCRGRLFGGCIEVLSPLSLATSIWPSRSDFWDDKVLFLEYSRELANDEFTRWFFRNLAAQGILSRIKALLIGRCHFSVKDDEADKILNAVLKIVVEEESLPRLPIIANMDFGHVIPMMTLPYGALTEIHCDNRSIAILEEGTV